MTLTTIMKKSIVKGVFPIEQKLPRVIPIFKFDAKQNVSNYSLISILTILAKY